MIGRDEVVDTLVAEMPRRRLLSIVGPGGIGKTTVTLAVAAALAGTYRDGVTVVDLVPVSDPLLVPSALIYALGLSGRSDAPLADLLAHLCDRQMLIVLDSCEHVIEAAATLAEDLLRQVPGVTLLASSREPLRAEGEWVHRLGPLGFPATTADLTAAAALGFPAIELFVERASACLGGYVLLDAEAPIVAELCARLDGIALAIELAAGRVDTIGVRGLANSLNDCFRVLTRGRRTALPRHQTLRATLDWSYRLLSEAEQRVFRRISLFNGGITLDAAQKVVGDGTVAKFDIEDAVANLVAKSLLTADVGGDTVHYRLLDTTRAYGRQMLEDAGERGSFARRHADYYRGLFEQAEAEWETRPTQEWLATYVGHIGNLRAALDWAFSAEGDPSTGVGLTIAAVPFWFALMLIDECLMRVQQALAYLETVPRQDGRRRMQLHAALGWPQMRAITGLQSRAAAWQSTLEIAEQLGDIDYQLRALWALWVDRTNHGESRAALAIADKFCALADRSGETADRCIGDRMRGKSLHILGDQECACEHLQRMLNCYVAPINRSHVVRFQYDQKIEARITLAQVLWSQGFPEQALALVAETIDQALTLDHVLSLCHLLADAACPIALLVGDLELAERYTKMLAGYTKAHSLDVWARYAECFAGDLLIRQGETQVGLLLLGAAIDELGRTGFVLYQSVFLSAQARGLATTGRVADAVSLIDSALAHCERTGERWYLAELHRLRGEILGGAEADFRRALAIAGAQGELSWELRAATSLARCHPTAETRGLLAAVLGRFTEGFDLPDLQAAALLAHHTD